MIYSDYKFANPPENPALEGGESSSARRAKDSDIRRLEFELERALMITEAMWSLLRDQHGYSDEDLLRRVYEVDAQDGSIDGRKAKSPPSKCVSCGRTLASHRPKCLYCGTLSPRPPFDR